MREFFCGWKRRIGVVTLLLTCAFAAGWLKSLTKCDIVYLAITRSPFLIISDRQNIQFIPEANREIDFEAQDKKGKKVSWLFGEKQMAGRTFLHGGLTVHLDSATYHDRNEQTSNFVRIPYWSIVLPLTAISAWLLLSKRRAKKPPVLAPTE